MDMDMDMSTSTYEDSNDCEGNNAKGKKRRENVRFCFNVLYL